MFRSILVPVDGSEPSNSAVAYALRLAGEASASLSFAHAVDVTKIIAMTSASSIGPSYAIESARDAGEEILREAKAQATSAKIEAATELVEGDCVTALLALALQKKADLIVVGSHGRSGISRALLGSVAEGILRRSPIPVLVIHAPRKAEGVTLAAVP